jgi:hypothetical protein
MTASSQRSFRDGAKRGPRIQQQRRNLALDSGFRPIARGRRAYRTPSGGNGQDDARASDGGAHEQFGMVTGENGTANYAQFMKYDMERYAAVVKKLNLQIK